MGDDSNEDEESPKRGLAYALATRDYEGSMSARRTVTDTCLSVAPRFSLMLVTTHISPACSNVSPTTKTRSVNQYSMVPFGVWIARVRGKPVSFSPTSRDGTGSVK